MSLTHEQSDTNWQTTIGTFLRDPYFAVGSGTLVPKDSIFGKGHKWVWYTSESVTDGGVIKNLYAQQIAANTGYPVVVIKNLQTGDWLNQSAADLQLPKTTAAMQENFLVESIRHDPQD